MDFETVYRRYFRDVYLYLYSLAGNEIVAEDIAQETFEKLADSTGQRTFARGFLRLQRTPTTPPISVRNATPISHPRSLKPV